MTAGLDPQAYLETLEPFTMRLGLDRMVRALDALGRPDRALRVLHVAGTNGKGSTCAMAAEALRRAGHRTGLYTSPHLVRFNERIAVDGAPIPDAALARQLEAVRAACPWHERGDREERLTYFEVATLVALLHFAAERTGAVVLEVGLGGRHDATSAVTPRACAITRIGLDHTAVLGGTLDAIAREKAGILKPGVPVAVADAQPAEALAAIREEAARRGAPLALAPRWAGPVGLLGPHQGENAGVAAAALRLLDAAGVTAPEAAVAAGIAAARWPGRLEQVGDVLLDGAHNPDGAEALARALAQLHPGRRVELVFGVLADKDHLPMLRTLAAPGRALHLVSPHSPRARGPETYREAAQALFARVDTHPDVGSAIACARAAARPDGMVCVAGSLYLVGEARHLLENTYTRAT